MFNCRMVLLVRKCPAGFIFVGEFARWENYVMVVSRIYVWKIFDEKQFV